MEQVISYAETALLVARGVLSWQMHWRYEYWSTMHMSHLHETHYWFPRCSQEFPKIYPHINCGLKYQKVQYTNKVKHSKPFNILELHSHSQDGKSKLIALAISIYFISGKSCKGGLHGSWAQGVFELIWEMLLPCCSPIWLYPWWLFCTLKVLWEQYYRKTTTQFSVLLPIPGASPGGWGDV